MALSDAAVGYVSSNVGLSIGLSGSAVGYVAENVGLSLTIAPEGVGYIAENVGLQGPTKVSLDQPQVGWGTPLVPARVVDLIPAMSAAVGYLSEGDVTS